MSGMTVAETVRTTGYPKTLINKKIWSGEIVLNEDGLIPEDTAERMLRDKTVYVSLAEYAKERTGGSFNGKKASERRKLLNHMEKKGFFGARNFSWGEILMGTETDGRFFLREELPVLDEGTAGFFRDYGVSEDDKIEAIIVSAERSGKRISCSFLRRFMADEFIEKGATPAVSGFVRAVSEMPDLPYVTPADIGEALKSGLSVTAKERLVKFLNYCRSKTAVKYGEAALNQPEARPVPAYSDETYAALMRCIFNAEYIDEHRMIEKALGNHLFAETWLYVSLFLTCGWRAADICRGWKYPRLPEREDGFLGISMETLYEDLLEDRLPDEVYESVCRYCLSGVDAAQALPSKTANKNPTVLTDVITPGLHSFYGLLTLIGEAVVLRTGDGYMKENRTSEYQNKVTLREFFGPEILEIIHGENLQSRRLNKVFLQGVEKAARDGGAGGLMASAVASYARNHTSLDTITTYLRDHRFTGETAEAVVYFMMERGVFGFEYYQAILTAYPEAVRTLPVARQSELISMAESAPMELELAENGMLAQEQVKQAFLRGDEAGLTEILKSMLEISQGRGAAKDEGIHCLLRAKGIACENPEYGSCLANGCRHLVFTRYGFVPLTKTLREWIGRASADPKDAAVLNKVILPRYRNVLNAVMNAAGTAREDRAGIKMIMGEILNEQRSEAG